MRVASEVGRGSTFTLTLPLAGATTATTAAAPPPADTGPPVAAVPARTRVLIVDDDADTLSLVRLLLPERHFEVVEAHDAFAGLREFYFRSPDIVLAAALLPLMSGLELCRIVKSHPERSALPVVILSAAAQEDEIRSGYQVGANAYLVKPFRSQDLLDTLQRVTAGQFQLTENALAQPEVFVRRSKSRSSTSKRRSREDGRRRTRWEAMLKQMSLGAILTVLHYARHRWSECWSE